MPNKDQTKFALICSITIALFLYHLSNDFNPVDENKLIMFKIAQFATIITFIIILMYNKLIMKLLFRDKFITGVYEGTSLHYKKETIDNKDQAIEKFSIKQNLFETVITGKSFKRNKGEELELVSTWFGRLFKNDENTFYFALELTSSVGEFGILKLTYDNQEFHGFYYPGSRNPYSYSIAAKLIC